MFHFIDTLKVRSQARNLKHDVSLYFKHQVIDKPVISGLVSGFLGGFVGSFTFIWVHNSLTWRLYTQESYRDIDFRKKNYLIFIASDFWSSFTRIFFETRKQLLQMVNKNILLSQIGQGWYLGLAPMILRDFLFRSSLLSVFYLTQEIEQHSELKYSLAEIIDYLNYWREVKGESDASYQNKSHLFIDHHSYKIKTPMQIRFLLMLLANAVGTLITNPIDVCMTKLITQQEKKYTGLINCMKTVYKEEGPKKFLSGIHPRFMFNTLNGIVFLYLYDQVVSTIYQANEYKEKPGL